MTTERPEPEVHFEAGTRTASSLARRPKLAFFGIFSFRFACDPMVNQDLPLAGA